MARVTVEDCVDKVSNRFDLVMVAAQRARELSAGAQMTIEKDDDKNPVVALREIAADTLDLERLREHLVTGLQRHVINDEPEDEGEGFGSGTEDLLMEMTAAQKRPAGRSKSDDELDGMDDQADMGDVAIDGSFEDDSAAHDGDR